MPTGTLTSRGRITIPIEVRKKLRLRSGMRVDFVFADDGSVRLLPKRIPFEKLMGMLHVPGMKPFTPRSIDRAIMQFHADEDKRIRAQYKRK